jgi:hypothetical protein
LLFLLRSAGTIYFSSASATLGNFGMANSFWFEVSVLLVGVFLAHYGGGCFITNLGCFFLDLFLFKTLCCDLGFSDLACCNLGLFGSKGPFMPAVFCHRGLWYVNSSVLAVGSFAVSYLSKCSLNTFFCYLVSRPCAGSPDSVR